MLNFKNLIKFYIICHLTLVNISEVLPQVHTRIVGGSPTTINRVPYLVQLHDNGRFFCGGTLISERYVVTAAHCVKKMKPERLTVVGGATTLTQPGVRVKVDKVILPKGFSMRTMNLDVAVLKLKSPLTGQSIKPIGLCDKAWKPGDVVKVSGWGLRNEYAGQVSKHLQTVNVKVIARPQCDRLYRNRKTLTKTMFCASIPGVKDACMGDSGGPAIINGQLCGIVSWGIGCARRSSPGVYTNVLTVRRFLRKAMQL